jgi:Yip1 domain
MNAFLRAGAMLADPFASWTRIEQEPGDPAYLLLRYVAPLALVPAAFGFLGACVVGATVPGVGSVRAPIRDGLFGAVFGYLETLATVVLLGLVINWLAPSFGGRRDFGGAFKLAAYSYTPVWLAGIFLLLPGLHFLLLTGFYGAYVLMIGLPLLMHSPAPKAQTFAASVVLCAGVLTFLAAAAQRALFGTPGF